MQYEFTEKSESVKTIEFVNSNPLINVNKITYFKEFGLSGNFIKKEFRYSWDDIVWAGWQTLTQQNVGDIEFNDVSNFWLEVKYTRANILSADIQTFYLFYDSNYETAPVPEGADDIDADTLGGELPIYYLNRANFFGPYSDLTISNVTDGSSAGVYDSRSDSSLGTEFFFKRLEGRNSISVYDGSDGKIFISHNDASYGTLDYIDGSLAARDTSIAYLDTLTQTHTTNIANLDTSVSALDTLTQTHTTDIANLDTSVSALDVLTQTHTTNIANLDTSVSALDVLTQTHTSDIANLDTSVSALDTLTQTHDISIGALEISISDLSTGKIDAVASTTGVSGHDVYSLEVDNISYIKKIVQGTGTVITSDSSVITIEAGSTTVNKYSANFTVAGTSEIITAATHQLGTGPFQVVLFDNVNDQVYVGTSYAANGDITLQWISGALTGDCSVFITG